MGDLLQDALSKRISIRDGDTVRKISRAEAIIRTLISKALKGDAKAFATLIALTQQSGEFEKDTQPLKVIPRFIVYPDGRREELP